MKSIKIKIKEIEVSVKIKSPSTILSNNTRLNRGKKPIVSFCKKYIPPNNIKEVPSIEMKFKIISILNHPTYNIQ